MSREEMKLLHELFMWLRELMPPSIDNARRQSAWAAKFRELDYPDPNVPYTPVEASVVHHELDEDNDDDPHEHGVPVRTRLGSARRKRGR
jgi:hypothetical protein